MVHFGNNLSIIPNYSGNEYKIGLHTNIWQVYAVLDSSKEGMRHNFENPGGGLILLIKSDITPLGPHPKTRLISLNFDKYTTVWMFAISKNP